MEDANFQQQLHTLKDRVNALTLQYSPRQAYVAPAIPLSPPRSTEDVFTAQLHDVKAHLNSLQASISQCEASMRQQPSHRIPELMQDEMKAQTRLTLPSGPLFWQLFNSLRSDFQTLDTRVAGLEQDVDALEDRVDRLEPDRFTPAGSTASQEDVGGVQIAPQKPTEDLLGASMACLPELCSGQNDASHLTQASQCHSRISSLQSQTNGAFEWQWPTGNYWVEDSMQRPYAMPMFRDQVTHSYGSFSAVDHAVSVHPEGVAFRDREIDRMDDQLRAVQESLQSSEALAIAKDTAMSDMQAQIENMQAENNRMAIHMARDTQVKKVQETQIRQLKRELDESTKAVRARDEEQRRSADSHLQTTADRDYAIRYWQERCEQEAAMFQHTVADRNRALQRWEESYNAASDAWRQENERAVALSSRLDQYRSDRRKELEQTHLSYEREMEKLKEFCEHKDAVIVKQERVMSRGGRLLEERDAEIDRLQRRLRVAEDDMQHEGRQHKRMARLLDETQTELESLRSSGEAKENSVDENMLAAQEQDLAMAASTEAGNGRDAFEIPGSYPCETRRSTDRRRGRHYDGLEGTDTGANEAARTGSPRPRRMRRHESLRHLPHHHMDDRQRRHERRASPPPLPHRMPDRENRKERFVADAARPQPELPERRRARFLDDTISFSNPPLPASVTARKMASEADLRSPNNATMRGTGAGRGLPKHQSMQELPGPRRRLQAYVETEGESDAEKDAQGRV